MKQNKNWLKNLPENIKINIGYEPKSKKYKYYLYKLDFRKKTDKNLKKDFQEQPILLILEENNQFIVVDACVKLCWNV